MDDIYQSFYWSKPVLSSEPTMFTLSFTIGIFCYSYRYSRYEIKAYSSQEYIERHFYDESLDAPRLVIMLRSPHCPKDFHCRWYNKAWAIQEKDFMFALAIYWAILNHPSPPLAIVLALSCIPELKPWVQYKLKEITGGLNHESPVG